MAFCVYGLVIHSESIDDLKFLSKTAVVVDNGKIRYIQENADLNAIQEQFSIAPENVIILKESEFLVPGMIDTHIHASQYVNAGFALDLPLLDWLNKYTFPTEAKFSDVNFAKKIYSRAVANTLANGTTTAMYFATIHKEASLVLADIAHQFGQRAFIGKVSMDQNSPGYYIENTEDAIKEVEDFITTLISKKYLLVQPALTPRFAISCSMDLMKKLGDMAQKYNINIQTHISENAAECDFVKTIHPECRDYVDIYTQAKLLNEKTILAHGIHFSDEELQILAKSQAAVSHCPNSNCSIRSGLCDVRRLMERGVPVGLGTDMSGGYSPSLLDAMRFAITVSNVLSLTKPKSYKPLTVKDVLFMATLGGAQALAVADRVGNFQVGKDFDALIVDMEQPEGNLDVWPGESHQDRLSKWIHIGDDRSIRRVYVHGVEVKQAAKKFLADARCNK